MTEKNPYKVMVQKGKTYFWCACGLSEKQPFCDGKHKKEEKFEPVKYTAIENGYVMLTKDLTKILNEEL